MLLGAVRRSAYAAVGPIFDERFPSWDFDMYLRIAIRFPVGHLDVWDSNFRVHTQQRPTANAGESGRSSTKR